MDKDEKKFKLSRNITKFAVGRSVTFVVATAVSCLVPTTSKFQKIELLIGSYVLGAMAADGAVKWTDLKFDELVKIVEDFYTEMDQRELRTKVLKDLDSL